MLPLARLAKDGETPNEWPKHNPKLSDCSRSMTPTAIRLRQVRAGTYRYKTKEEWLSSLSIGAKNRKTPTFNLEKWNREKHDRNPTTTGGPIPPCVAVQQPRSCK